MVLLLDLIEKLKRENQKEIKMNFNKTTLKNKSSPFLTDQNFLAHKQTSHSFQLNSQNKENVIFANTQKARFLNRKQFDKEMKSNFLNKKVDTQVLKISKQEGKLYSVVNDNPKMNKKSLASILKFCTNL